MPLQNTKVLGPTWSAHHRPTATATMTATCVITRRGVGGTTDADGKWTPAAATTVYTGPCRVQALWAQLRVLTVGEAQETRRRYLVTVRHDTADIHIDDVVTVTSEIDTMLDGRMLRVADVTFGSEQWERDMTCDELES